MSQTVTIPYVDATKPVNIYYCDITGEDCVYVARVFTFPYSFEVPSPYDYQSFTIKIVDANNCVILDVISITPTPTVTTGLTPTATPSNTKTPTVTPTQTNTQTSTNTSTPTNTISYSPSRTPISTKLPNDCVPGTTPSNPPSNSPTNTPTLTPTPTIFNQCASCPGSGWQPYDSENCYRINITGATPPINSVPLFPRSFDGYSNSGTSFYDVGFNLDGSGTILLTSSTAPLWKNDPANTINGPMNRCAVWYSAFTIIDTWLGFSTCLTGITNEKTYYVGIGADNEYRLVLDGIEILNTIGGSLTERDKFNFWHVYPVTIPVGNHTLELYGLDYGAIAGFGMEIYDNTLSELTGATTINDINIIFSSSGYSIADLVQTTGGTYISSGYTCPSGYVYSTCSGSCVEYEFCSLITTTPTVTPTNSITPTITSSNTSTPTATPTITPTPTTTPQYQFISTWMTTTSGETVTLPYSNTGTYAGTIDWGDSSVSANTYANRTHTYASPGTYTITITGVIVKFGFGNAGDKLKIRSVIQWGPLNLGNVGGYFWGCSNLVLTGVTDTLNLAGTTSLYYMFSNCTSITTINNLDSWDVSAITDMQGMFNGATSFNQDINSWDVSSVTNMFLMFNNAQSFNGNITSWNTSSVTNMWATFMRAYVFNQNIDSWDVSNVTTMIAMFSFTFAFNQSLNSWDVSSVTDMQAMFNYAPVFNGNISSWNVSGVTNMGGMFALAYAFNQNIDSWNVSSVTNMQGMFNAAYAFNSPLNSWNVSNVTNMAGMFSIASSFNQNIDSWNVSSVVDMSNMFGNASAFNQSLNSWNTSSVINMSSMFNSAASFDSNISSWNVSNVTDMTAMFANTPFNQPIGSWNVSGVTTMQQMFAGDAVFNQNIGSWDVSNVGNMSAMFFGSTAFNQPIGSWNVSSVGGMNSMFLAAGSFNQPISGWNVSNVTDMGSMFDSATAFDQDIGSWVVTGITVFDGFMSYKTAYDYSTTNLDSIYNGWSSQNVNTGLTIDFGSINYTSSGAAGRLVLTGTKGWTITDGGQV